MRARVFLLSLIGVFGLLRIMAADASATSHASQANTAAGYYEQGNKYLKAERCSEAVEAFKKAIALEPASGAYNDLGRAYFCLVKYPEAEAAFKQAIRLKPENVNALYNLGLAYCHQTKIEEAHNVLLQLQSKDPERAKKLDDEIKLARVANKQMEEGRKAIEEARKALDKARHGGANDYEAQGDKYVEAKEYVKALEAYKKAISLTPSMGAYNGLGLSYSALKQYPNSVSAFQQAIRLLPSDAILRYNLAVTFFKMEEYENAQSPVREALRLKPDYVDAIHLLGLTHVRLKQYPEATALFQQAIRLTPNDAVLHLNLGKSYFLTGRKEEAQQEYRTLLRLDKEVAQKLLEMINGASAEKK